MNPERLVYKAVRHMFDTRPKATKRHNIATRNNTYVQHCRGDLLMDVSPKLEWQELVQLAANRKGWRRRVDAIAGKSGITVTMSGKGGKVVRNFMKVPTTKPTPAPESESARAANRYRKRDAHEAFFRPGGTSKSR